MADYLSELEPKLVAAWYYRLVNSIATQKIGGETPLAAVFLKHWLDNRVNGSVFHFEAPNYLKNSPRVTEVLMYHRDVFLTKSKARINGREVWAGVVPRLQGSFGQNKWSLANPIQIRYHSLCDIAPNVTDIIRIQNSGSAAERDLMTSLRGFQLHSEVTVSGKELSDKKVEIRFNSWRAKVEDTYDWNYDEYLTVPNPDFGSQDKNAVRPKDGSIRVYHKNAKRLEDAKLAAPYRIESNYWFVSEHSLTKQESVDPNRKLK